MAKRIVWIVAGLVLVSSCSNDRQLTGPPEPTAASAEATAITGAPVTSAVPQSTSVLTTVAATIAATTTPATTTAVATTAVATTVASTRGPSPTVATSTVATAVPTIAATAAPTTVPVTTIPAVPQNDALPLHWSGSGDYSTGNRVTLVQQRLNLWGFPCDVDGRYGPATKATVTRFQYAEGMTADGVVGSETLALLQVEPPND